MSFTKRGSGIMSHMNNYVRSRCAALSKNALFAKYDGLSVENMIRAYKDSELPESERKFVLETLFLKIFFYFPSFLSRKKYKLNINLYDEALQNISHKMLDAINRFDPDKGYPFLAYAYGDMLSAMAQTFKELNLVQLPQTAKKRAAYRDDVRPLDPVGDTEDEDNDDLAVDLFVSNPETGLMYAADIGYSDEPLDEEATTTVCKPVTLSDTDDSVDVEYETNLHKTQLNEWLEEALSSEAGVLTEDERLVVTLHNGLFGVEPMIYSEIAELRKRQGKGCSRSRISQIHTKALKKLKRWFRAMRVRS